MTLGSKSLESDVIDGGNSENTPAGEERSAVHVSRSVLCRLCTCLQVVAALLSSQVLPKVWLTSVLNVSQSSLVGSQG